MKKEFKKGDVVEITISTYPYSRVGKVLDRKYNKYHVLVEYPSRKCVLKRKAEQLTLKRR